MRIRNYTLTFLMVCVLSTLAFGQTQTEFLTSVGAGTWIVPDGVYSITVSCWGGGGGGGGAENTGLTGTRRGSGGGGGGFTSRTFSVTPGSPLSYSVGAGGLAGGLGGGTGGTGGSSFFTVGSTTITASGGVGGPGTRGSGNGNAGTGGSGGTGSGGTTNFSGGNGGTANGNGAGGGGAAGPTANGGAGANAVTGLGAPDNPAGVNGGNGGAFRSSNGDGNNAQFFGGGGGGARSGGWGDRPGGFGRQGIIQISYCIAPQNPSAGSDVSICPSESVQLNGSATPNNLLTGSRTFSYSGTGFDCSNFRVGGFIDGLPSGAIITSIVFDASIGAFCPSWYEWDFIVNNVLQGWGCDGTGFVYTGLNGQPANGQLVQLGAWDTDAWCDVVTLIFSFTVDYELSVPGSVTYSWSPPTGLSATNIPDPTASPSSTTTYTLAVSQNGCTNPNTSSITVTVDPLVTANAGSPIADICQGGTSSAMGGSVGGSATGGTWSGGAGTWTNPSDPAGAIYTAGATESGPITLTLTTTGGCGGPIADTKVINVNAPSTDPSSIDVSNLPFCIGGEATLTRVGGSLASGASWEWFSGSCGTTPAGTGTTIGVSPTTNTTYYVRASAAGGCPPSNCAQITVNAPNTSSNLANNNDQANCYVPEGDWIHFYSSGRLIASVRSQDEDLGELFAQSFVGTPHLVNSCTEPSNAMFETAALGRSIVIRRADGTPLTLSPGNTADVRIYFSEAEWQDYLTESANSTSPDDTPSSLSIMQGTKFSHNDPTLEDGDPTNNCSDGTTQFLTNSGTGTTFNVAGNDYIGDHYIQYTVNSFSEFYAMFSGANNSALPVSLTSFSASCHQDKINVTWSTASELNASHYILQSSRDGQTWLHLAEIDAAGTTNQTSHYSFADQNFGTLTYYRLVQVDNDGQQEIFGPISSNCSLDLNMMTVHPNPTSENFTVLIQTAESFESAVVELMDMSGRVVMSQTTNINAGSTMLNFDGKSLHAGTYMLRVKDQNDKFAPVRVVKM